MSIVSVETVKYLADLARIQLTDNELNSLSKELKDILDFVDKLKSLNVEGIAPTASVLDISNILREDIAKPSLDKEKVLKISVARKDDFFLVPKVIE
jgi:aspartyl-tRNA(Asn)/glutamyl-tRNA(Gln) amidotransferase subunit C